MSSTEVQDLEKVKRYKVKQLARLITSCFSVSESAADKIRDLVIDLNLTAEETQDMYSWIASKAHSHATTDRDANSCLLAAMYGPDSDAFRHKLWPRKPKVWCETELVEKWHKHFYDQQLPNELGQISSIYVRDVFHPLEDLKEILKGVTYNMVKMNIILSKLKDIEILDSRFVHVNAYDFYELYLQLKNVHVRQSLVKAADRWSSLFKMTTKKVLLVIDCSPSFRLAKPRLFNQACCFAASQELNCDGVDIMLTAGTSQLFRSEATSVIPKADEMANWDDKSKFTYESIPKALRSSYDKLLIFSDEIYHSRNLVKSLDGCADEFFHVKMSGGNIPQSWPKNHYSVSGYRYDMLAKL